MNGCFASAKPNAPAALDDELERMGRIPLVICDEVAYIPFDPEAAALFIALVSSRYEGSILIVSSNKTFLRVAGDLRGRGRVTAMVIGSCTTPRSSCSGATAIGSRAKERRLWDPKPIADPPGPLARPFLPLRRSQRRLRSGTRKRVFSFQPAISAQFLTGVDRVTV